jgi:hypothetical protein
LTQLVSRAECGFNPADEALARPGTVCISQTVHEQVRNKLDLDYCPLGSHRGKISPSRSALLR